jgi:hypothetical protein
LKVWPTRTASAGRPAEKAREQLAEDGEDLPAAEAEERLADDEDELSVVAPERAGRL